MLAMTRRLLLFTLAVLVGAALVAPRATHAQEAILAEETFGPGVHAIFEGAIKDDVTPRAQHLSEENTDIHIEARVTWAPDESVDVPEGAQRGGFVPYLRMWARVTNEETGRQTFVTLVPHLNLGDNMHYGRNMALPGPRDGTYRVTFRVAPPQKFALSLHRDWREQYGNQLFEQQTFTYEGLNFEEVANATRR